MSRKITFSSDLHGNIDHYDELFKKVEKNGTDLLIIGGDFFPYRTSPLDQIDIFKRVVVPYLRKCKSKVLLVFGNTDHFVIQDEIRKQLPDNTSLVVNDLFELSNDFYLMCLSSVPFTPFKDRDFERYDEGDKETYKGIMTVNMKKKFIKVSKQKKKSEYLDVIVTYDQSHTIRHEIDKTFSRIRNKNVKYAIVSHGPPHNTKNDLEVIRDSHYGSKSLRKFVIEECGQTCPVFLLCGHIHGCGTVRDFLKSKKGKCTVLSSGNSPKIRQVRGWNFVLDTKEGKISNLAKL